MFHVKHRRGWRLMSRCCELAGRDQSGRALDARRGLAPACRWIRAQLLHRLPSSQDRRVSTSAAAPGFPGWSLAILAALTRCPPDRMRPRKKRTSCARRPRNRPPRRSPLHTCRDRGSLMRRRDADVVTARACARCRNCSTTRTAFDARRRLHCSSKARGDAELTEAAKYWSMHVNDIASLNRSQRRRSLRSGGRYVMTDASGTATD